MRVPLFPLSAVLFPDGVLPLRVFEARYMDMVRDCMKAEAPFGVVLIARGREAGGRAEPFGIGCLARITLWDMQQLGVLNLRTVGLQRFRIDQHSAQADGLQVGEVTLLEPDDDAPVPPQHRACVDLLQRILDDAAPAPASAAAAGAADVPSSTTAAPFEPPWRLDSSAWVSNRLCEVLPVPLKAKQKLMELTHAPTRLDIVHTYLKQHSIIA